MDNLYHKRIVTIIPKRLNGLFGIGPDAEDAPILLRYPG